MAGTTGTPHACTTCVAITSALPRSELCTVKYTSLLSLALAVFAFTGCGDDSTTGPTPTPRTVQVSPTGAFGPSGTVTITNTAGSNSQLTASLIGFDASSDHSVAIVLGSCAAPGATSVTLPNISANSSGQATISSTSVPDAVASAGYAIVFYESTSSTGAVIACGDLG
jgi:hypothetical protein